MILATHALTGAVIGKNVTNIPLVIVISIAAHFILDYFRHGEYFDERTATLKNTYWKVIIDLSIGFFIIFFYIKISGVSLKTALYILSGSFFSLFPDFLTVLHYKFKNIKILTEIKKFHGWIHNYAKFPKYSFERQWTLRNAANDIIISILAIIFLFI